MSVEHRHPIDLRRMRVVVEVARTQAITTAAQALGLTQSAVSRSVAELEHSLGQELFERLPRGIRATAAGERFITRAKRILADVDDLVSDVSEATGRVTGRLRLGLDATGWHAIPAFTAFANTHPLIAIETVHASAASLYPRLLSGELDVVLGSSRYLRRWQDLEVVALSRLHFACLLRNDHPVNKLARPREADVLRFPLILPQSVEPTFSDIFQRYAHHGLLAVQPHYVSDSFDFVMALIRATDAFFPMMHPNEDFSGLGQEFLLLRDVVKMPEHHLSYACAAGRARSAVVELFVGQLESTFAVHVRSD
jgi:DNA-binding transcriptional LysR family regulator